MKLSDLSNIEFGRWTVLYLDKKRTDVGKGVYWICECQCKTIKSVYASSLKSGKSKSCGCLNRELAKERNKRHNLYDLCGEYGVGYTLKNEEFYFDLEDYDKIKNYTWYINDNGYIRSTDRDGCDRKYIHQIITNQRSGVVDHINHNLTDNRKINLRETAQLKNSCNSKLRKNNTSGVTGVRWCDIKNKWKAYITVNYKGINLGSFDDFEDAVYARKEAERTYQREYSYEQSMKIADEFQIIKELTNC